jgi:transposase
MWQPKGGTVEIPAPGTNRKLPIYGALNYRTNRVSHRVGTGKNSRNFLAFLAQLAAEYRGRRCVLVLDNASYHTSIVVADYLRDMTDAFEVAWLPPYSPELNDIERIWKYVKGAAMANHDFGEVASLREAVDGVFEDLNRSEDHDLSLRFRDPLAKPLLEAA